MKTDLTEEQFKAVVAELAKVFTGGTFGERAFPEGITPGCWVVPGAVRSAGPEGARFDPSLGCSWGSGLLQFTPNSRVVRAVG